MNTPIPFISLSNSITAMVNGKTLVAKAAHPNFTAIKEALKAGVTTEAASSAALAALFDIAKSIETRSQGAVQIVGNNVLYMGKPLHNTLTERMIAMLGEGFDIQPLINFLTRLMKNPSFRATNGLFDFLAATNIPITPEGKFLAFKKVRSDYLDIHSGTIRNAVGDEPRMPRNKVNEDPEQTCSYGLHVCSESYLPHFGGAPGNRVVIVEVDPEDVVAIPKDYNNAKMRCAGYKVIGEVAQADVPRAFSSAVMSSADFAVDATPTFYDEEGIEDEDEYLSDEPTEVIRDVDGVTITFTREDEDSDWVASWKDPDGEDTEVDTEEFEIEYAVDFVRENHLEEVSTYTAEVRWLDGDGELQIVVVTLENFSTEDGPEDWDFFEEIETEDDLDGAKVVNITQVAGTVRKRGGYG